MKKLVALFLTLVISFPLGLFGGMTAFADAQSEYVRYSSYEVLKINKEIETPKSIEAKIKLPTDYEKAGGIILGNYLNSLSAGISFEISINGCPYFRVSDGDNIDKVIYFTDVDVRSDRFIDLAFTWDNNEVKVYIDGELKGTKTFVCESDLSSENIYCVGGDLSEKNRSYFKGEIASLNVFSSCRSQDEIQEDMVDLNLNDEDLICAYDLTQKKVYTIEDLSPNNADLTLEGDMLFESNTPKDYDYSFMAIGDTQMLVHSHPEKFHHIYDYVLDNIETNKVKHVFGLGDITEKDATPEWSLAYEHIQRLSGVVPYTIVRGNHDLRGAPDPEQISNFDLLFGGSDSFYASEYFDSYDGYGEQCRGRNTVHEIVTEKFDYLVVAIDCNAVDKVLEWADGVISAHPYHNVILVTHELIGKDGEIFTGDPAWFTGANKGVDIWNKLVKKHKNIVLTLCGHVSNNDIAFSQIKGDNGNVVSNLMINPQGLDSGDAIGLVANLFFSEGGKKVSVNYFSSVHNKYYGQESQFTFDINVVYREGEEPMSTLAIVLLSAGGVIIVGACALVAVKLIKRKKQK